VESETNRNNNNTHTHNTYRIHFIDQLNQPQNFQFPPFLHSSNPRSNENENGISSVPIYLASIVQQVDRAKHLVRCFLVRLLARIPAGLLCVRTDTRTRAHTQHHHYHHQVVVLGLRSVFGKIRHTKSPAVRGCAAWNSSIPKLSPRVLLLLIVCCGCCCSCWVYTLR
jgi:hypothetical protein